MTSPSKSTNFWIVLRARSVTCVVEALPVDVVPAEAEMVVATIEAEASRFNPASPTLTAINNIMVVALIPPHSPQEERMTRRESHHPRQPLPLRRRLHPLQQHLLLWNFKDSSLGHALSSHPHNLLSTLQKACMHGIDRSHAHTLPFVSLELSALRLMQELRRLLSQHLRLFVDEKGKCLVTLWGVSCWR